MRGATLTITRKRENSAYFNPRAPCGARPTQSAPSISMGTFQSTRPMRGATPLTDTMILGYMDFNPRAPCGARPEVFLVLHIGNLFQSTRPMRGATSYTRVYRNSYRISIHAPHAGRDSKSIQNYFTHFCDKRQFLDNFTQNAAF